MKKKPYEIGEKAERILRMSDYDDIDEVQSVLRSIWEYYAIHLLPLKVEILKYSTQ